VQQKLDVLANDVLMKPWAAGREWPSSPRGERGAGHFAQRHPRVPRYLRAVRSVDGSSNLDICGGVGTIFSILAYDDRSVRAQDSLLQPGTRQVAAGYVLYGSSTISC